MSLRVQTLIPFNILSQVQSMASTVSEPLHAPHIDPSSSEDEYGDDEDDVMSGDRKESSHGCDPLYGKCRPESRNWFAGMVLDPRGKRVQEWNKAFLLICAISLFIDPLFFYALSISETCLCLFIDGWFAVNITVVRCMIDVVHLWNMWLQFKMKNFSSHIKRGDEKMQNTNFKAIILGHFKSKRGFFFDLFVVLLMPQIGLWMVTPYLLNKGATMEVMTVFLILFVFQYIPKVYHSISLLRRMQSVYFFSTVWWGFALSMLAYFVASHATGACWYVLGIQRATKCLKEQCEYTRCGLRTLSCENPIYYGLSSIVLKDRAKLSWAENINVRSMCTDSSDDGYDYGVYKWTVQLVMNNSRLEKILFPIFWGLMTLSTFGNLQCTTDLLEVVFNIIILTSGLLLVTMLMGNIKVFLHATTSKKQAMDLRMRNLEWWMGKRRMPQSFRQRVRQYERQKWAATRGVDEFEIVRNLPEGLRRDIKYHLCLDLVRQVPLFQHMDDLVLENICDRVKSLIFPKGEIITKEGDPVQRMLFVVRGHVQSSQTLRDGIMSSCMLGPGNFSGDELLSWCLRRPFIERLPPSAFTLVTLETTEAFGLDAEDVKYVTQHFRYTFMNEKIKRSARYYSPWWRTWAAVAIQLAWRRYKHRLTLTRRALSRSSSLGEDKLRLYTALLTSPKPDQDEFSF